MKNFSIHFQYPWLLLLLIPAFALTFFLYFRLDKRYRRTRNRIVSVVLHLVVSVLCTFILAGMDFRYTVANTQNEIILLVDVSDSQEDVEEARDSFIRTVLNESAYDGYRVGIVTFGFTQQYAVPLTYDTETVFDAYKSAPLPDTTATDVAAALRFARGLFTEPRTSKIVLITDGMETDEEALSVIRPIAAQGIRVDTVQLSSSPEDAVQTLGVELIKAGREFSVNVRLGCKEAQKGVIVRLFDNGVPCGESQSVDLATSEQVVTFPVTFAESGLHELRAQAVLDSDGLEENNSYTTYYFVEEFNRVLILEQKEGESASLENLLMGGDFVVDIINIHDPEHLARLPRSVEEMCDNYDQVILNNISNADLRGLSASAEEDDEDWFVKMLNSYVRDYGGGMFTTGGYDTDGAVKTPHAYNRTDMNSNSTLYQDMLPVQITDYTPPFGVMIIVDISSSMNKGSGGETNLHYAKEAASSCLDQLQDRDYVGVMTLDSNYGMVVSPTRVTEKEYIKEQILKIGEGHNTIFSDAIKSAGEALRALDTVDKRHIVMITDGMPAASDHSDYFSYAEELYDNFGITLSVLGVGMKEDSEEYTAMRELVDAAGGEDAGSHFYRTEKDNIIGDLEDDLRLHAVGEYEEGEFEIFVNDPLSPLLNGVDYGGEDAADKRRFGVSLGGYYGARKRDKTEVVLVGEYEVPLYAQWQYGKGMVGSFMCDLSGVWSKALLSDGAGMLFLRNVVAGLMPLENIRPPRIKYEMREGNYMNELSLYPELNEGETLFGTITEVSSGRELSLNVTEGAEAYPDFYVTEFMSAENGFSRCGFVVKHAGVYRINIIKQDAEGGEICDIEIYKSFAFSAEYDTMRESDGGALLAELSEKGGGAVVDREDPWAVFEGFVTRLDKRFDPRLTFIIVAMVLFLLDIVVRKFKFKWIHELVREHRRKKEEGRS